MRVACLRHGATDANLVGRFSSPHWRAVETAQCLKLADWTLEPRIVERRFGDFLYRFAVGIALHGGDRIYSGGNATLAIFDIDWPNVRLVDFDAPLNVG